MKTMKVMVLVAIAALSTQTMLGLTSRQINQYTKEINRLLATPLSDQATNEANRDELLELRDKMGDSLKPELKIRINNKLSDLRTGMTRTQLEEEYEELQTTGGAAGTGCTKALASCKEFTDKCQEEYEKVQKELEARTNDVTANKLTIEMYATEATQLKTNLAKTEQTEKELKDQLAQTAQTVEELRKQLNDVFEAAVTAQVHASTKDERVAYRNLIGKLDDILITDIVAESKKRGGK